MTHVHRALSLLNIPKNMSRCTLLLLWNVSLASQHRLPLRFDVLFCPRYALMVWKKSRPCRHPTCSSFPLRQQCCQRHSAGLMALLLHEDSWKKKKERETEEGTHMLFFLCSRLFIGVFTLYNSLESVVSQNVNITAVSFAIYVQQKYHIMIYEMVWNSLKRQIQIASV